MKKAIVILLIIFSCNTKDKDISSRLFNVQGLNSKVEEVKKQGFNRVFGIDVLFFRKTENETIIDLEFDIGKNPSIYCVTWKVKMGSNKINYIENFINDNGAILVTPICNYDADEFHFTVVDSKHNNTFLCKVLEENKSYYLNVIYYYPNKTVKHNLSSEILQFDDDEESIPK
jgi:hypothetical protein